ncbi:hypothetical protein DCC85_18765 [Paenibacillus sp. CAA11]|uniref:hypothetical protein n=1 Tax=Paenibacillus sp. CAA11 TaxID=1532905 RepID=UPI000D353216|nr:hypothetical protein [Paenibacillus sp. CAA11]AWB46010.1 hypothetical protein DCC85_18765 [Paenibacillus sp. CAA11]
MNRLKLTVSKMVIDLKIYKQPAVWLCLAIYAAYLLSILSGDPDKPRTVYYYSELGMFPLSIIITGALFQRELSGGTEVLASYPVSLGLMTLRKWLLSVMLVLLAHVGWMGTYLWKYGGIRAKLYSWSGGEPSVSLVSPLQLLQQITPAYLFLMALTTCCILLVHRVYVGLLISFGIWILETLTSGLIMARWTLYATYLPPRASYTANRVGLMVGCIFLLVIAVVLAGRRSRWLSKEEEE